MEKPSQPFVWWKHQWKSWPILAHDGRQRCCGRQHLDFIKEKMKFLWIYLPIRNPSNCIRRVTLYNKSTLEIPLFLFFTLAQMHTEKQPTQMGRKPAHMRRKPTQVLIQPDLTSQFYGFLRFFFLIPHFLSWILIQNQNFSSLFNSNYDPTHDPILHPNLNMVLSN